MTKAIKEYKDKMKIKNTYVSLKSCVTGEETLYFIPWITSIHSMSRSVVEIGFTVGGAIPFYVKNVPTDSRLVYGTVEEVWLKIEKHLNMKENN